MQPTRRHFVRLAAGIAFCAHFPLRGIAQNRSSGVDRAEETEDPLAGVTAETFSAWIGSQFRATLNRQPAGTLKLLAVTTLDPKPGTILAAKAVTSPAMTSFALRFSKAGAPLTQEAYTLEHDWLGTFQLLLVPSGAHSNPATCTAVFTLLQ
jgi:hypothetical protein